MRVPNGRIHVDGNLDEAEWNLAQPVSDFLQVEPHTGQPVSERTEVRLLYDDTYLYVGAYLYDSAGRDGIVLNSLAKDFVPFDSDHFNTVFDTFHDQRDGVFFNTNPGGAKKEEEFARDGAETNTDWDGIWHVKTRITEAGWQVEEAIPFRTLRFRDADEQVWGINFQRLIRRKNETAQWSLIPRPYRIQRVSMAGTLRGISGVHPGLNLYVKPYISAPVTRGRGDDVDFRPDVGMDLKYSVTSQMTLDLTVNTDFSQVEADNQQVNLTRFNLFFPEKREFFLESATLFRVGPFTGQSASTRDLVPFFSRRIGIADGQLVPILGGARLTGTAGDYRFGLLNIEVDRTSRTPATNFSVLRLRRNLLGRSDIGGVFINKQESGGRSNRTFGSDVNFNFRRYIDISSFLLRTETTGVRGPDAAAYLSGGWQSPRLTFKGGYLGIGKNFNPEVGFVPRTGIRKTTGDFSWRMRPERQGIRQFEPSVSLDYITNSHNILETRAVDARLTTTLQNGGIVWFGHESFFERLVEPFRIRPNRVIPVGDYRFNDYIVSLTSDRSRMLSGDFTMTRGDFYDGDKNSYRTGARLQAGAHFLADLVWTRDNVHLRSGAFRTNLVSTRLLYAFSPVMSVNALIQYNSDLREYSSNIRFNYTYKPLSDLFLVYNEKRAPGGNVTERALIAKLTYIFAF